MSQIQTHRRKSYWLYIFFALFFSFLYTSIVDGFNSVFPFINTSIIGILIGIFTALFELEFMRKIQRHLKFLQILIVRSLFYIFLVTVVIFLELAVARIFRYGLSLAEVLRSEEFRHYISEEDFGYAILYAFLMIVLFNFTRELVKKLGQGVFINFITGKYVKPVLENKIIMFINIQATDKIIKELGRLKFHSFLKEFVDDITESIISFKGKIYEYVDDQVIVIWDPEDGLNNSNCIRAFFEAKDHLREHKEKYFLHFGIFPRINVALHRGDLVHGELGYIKSNIVYSGDVMNTTARILEACNDHSKDILVTAELVNEISLPVIYEFQYCGEYTPRGKHEKLQIHTVVEKDIEYV